MVALPIVFIFAFVSASASFPEPSSCSSGGDEPCSLADEETVNLLQVANKNALGAQLKASQPKKQQAEDQKDSLDKKDLQRLEQLEENMTVRMNKTNMTVRMNKTEESTDNKDTHRQKIKEAFELDDSEADAVESALATDTMSKALQRKGGIDPNMLLPIICGFKRIATGRYCNARRYFNRRDPNCATRCQNDKRCQGYTTYSNGWCQIWSSCSRTLRARDQSAESFARPNTQQCRDYANSLRNGGGGNGNSCTYRYQGKYYSNDAYLADLRGSRFTRPRCEQMCTNWRSECPYIRNGGSYRVSNPCYQDCGGFTMQGRRGCTLYEPNSRMYTSSRTPFYKKTCR